MAEKVFTKITSAGCVIEFKYDDVTLKVLKCKVSGIPAGKKIETTVKDNNSNEWNHTFTTNTTKTVTPAMYFDSAELDGIFARAAIKKV